MHILNIQINEAIIMIFPHYFFRPRYKLLLKWRVCERKQWWKFFMYAMHTMPKLIIVLTSNDDFYPHKYTLIHRENTYVRLFHGGRKEKKEWKKYFYFHYYFSNLYPASGCALTIVMQTVLLSVYFEKRNNEKKCGKCVHSMLNDVRTWLGWI